MIGVHVSGGTGAGKRRPLREKPEPWTHICTANPAPSTMTVAVQLAGYFATCPYCAAVRP